MCPAVTSRAVEQKLRAAAQAQAETKDFRKRPFAERKAALNLAQFARQNQDLNISADQVENLVSTLIVSPMPPQKSMTSALTLYPQAEAPPEVVAMCTETATSKLSKDPSIPPSPPESDQPENGVSQKEREALTMIQELIRRRLEGTISAP